MEITYEEFLKSGINLEPLGCEPRQEPCPYFCTPEGAKVFGWAGVDGIHFCQIPGFGEMVFAVSPMDGPVYVRPVAQSFGDFLRLLLACRDTCALEQAWRMDLRQFEAFCEEIPRHPVLDDICQTFDLEPMDAPWYYLKQLQSEFDDTSIPYTQEYYELTGELPAESQPWNVWFHGGFYGRNCDDQEPGTELPLGTVFRWADRNWVIPAAYVCQEGLVVDIAMEVEPSSIQAFLEAWDLTSENEAFREFTREERMRLELDNPMTFRFNTQLLCNERLLRSAHGSGVPHNPCVPQHSLEAQEVLRYYGLDPDMGWMLWRLSYPWEGACPQEIETLRLTMLQQPVSVPGLQFQVQHPGDKVQFHYQGKSYTLSVEEYEHQIVDVPPFPGDDRIFPNHLVAMAYTIDPELPKGRLSIQDCAESDQPKNGGGGFGIIGGADGPTAIFVGSGVPRRPQAACSAVHFQPVSQVQWRMIFHEIQYRQCSVDLT